MGQYVFVVDFRESMGFSKGLDWMITGTRERAPKEMPGDVLSLAQSDEISESDLAEVVHSSEQAMLANGLGAIDFAIERMRIALDIEGNLSRYSLEEIEEIEKDFENALHDASKRGGLECVVKVSLTARALQKVRGSKWHKQNEVA